MKQWMSARFQLHSSIKGVQDQRIVIVIPNYVGYDPAVIKIQNSTQIYFVNFDPDVILELCHIGEPFFVWCVSMKIPVKIVPCDVCRIIAAFSTVLRFPFDCRLDVFLSADPQDPFIIDTNFVVPVQLIPYSAVSHIRMLFMDGSYFFRDLLVSPFAVTDWIFQPTVVGCAGKVQILTKSLYRIVVLFRQLFDRLIFVQMTSQR